MNYIKNKIINIEPELFLCLGDCINLEFTIPIKENGIQLYNENYQYYFVAQNNNKKRRKYEAIKVVENEENFIVTWTISENLTNQIGEIIFSFLIEHNTDNSKDFIYSSLPNKIKVYNTLIDKNLPLGDLEDINPNNKINGSNLIDNSVSGKKLNFDFVGNGLKFDNGLLSLDTENSDSNFELIETIVLTEEVNVVERTKEPNGTDYNFKELYVNMRFPDFDKMESNVKLKALNIRGLFQNDFVASYSSYSYIVSMLIDKSKVINQTKHTPFMHCHLSLRNGLYKHSCSYGYGGEYGSRGGFINSDIAILSNKSINGIHIGCNTNFPVAATPTIEIYGIRA